MSRDARYCVLPDLALVLAGGLGTRLRLVLADRPKSLAPAAGRPFLHYVLAYLKRQGVKRVVLCVGYLADQVQAYAGDGRDWGLEIRYSLEGSALGTGGALRQASAGLTEPFFALNGDTLFCVDLPALWDQHQSLGCLATVALLRVDDASARGRVRVAADGRILSFDEKPVETQDIASLQENAGVETQNIASLRENAGVETQNIASLQENAGVQTQNIASVRVNGGVYVLDPRALAGTAAGQAASIERDIFPRLAAEGQLAGFEQDVYFADIGTPESLSAFERDVQNNRINRRER